MEDEVDARRAPRIGAGHFLMRLPGLPLATLRALRFERTSRASEASQQLCAEREQLGAELCDALAACVPVATLTERRLLLELKRDVFNNRAPGSAWALTVARGLLAPEAGDQLLRWQESWGAARALSEAQARSFDEELAEGRRRLRELFANPEFQQAVLLSAPTLSRNLQAYLVHPPEAPLPKALRHTEQTLVAYLARMATKPTPYGHFASVLLGQWRAEGPVLSTEAFPGSPVRLARLSRALLAVIEEALVADPGIADALHPRLNSTCHRSGRHLRVFVRGRDGTPEGPEHESLLQLEAHAPLLFVVQTLSRTPPPALRECAASLAPMLGGSLEEARGLLLRLIQMGVVELDFGIPDQAVDPLGALCQRLEHIPGETARQAHGLLSRLAMAERRFAGEDVPARKRSLEELGTICAELGRLLRTPLLPPPAEVTLLHEDVAHRPGRLELGESSWRRALYGLGLLQRLVPLFDECTAERVAMFELFRASFGDSQRVNLLTWYTWLRQLSRKELEAALLRARGALAPVQERFWDQLAAVRAACSGDTECLLEEAWVEDFLQGLPAWVIPWECAAHFCQPLASDEAGQARVVWNRSGLGFGKHFSRHAPLFGMDGGDNPLIRSVRETHEKAWKGLRICADLQGVLGADVNLHPALLPYEVLYPGSLSEGPAEAVLTLLDLEVVADSGRQCLELYSQRLGTRITLVPLGSLYPSSAPPLYAFLSGFALTRGSQLSFWAHFEAARAGTLGGTMRHYPRLVMGNVVVERATWKVPRALLPQREPNQGDREYFIEVQRWRRRLGLPREVFVRAAPWLEDPAAEPGGWWNRERWREQAGNRRAHKPMFVDFDNAFLVSLMSRYLASASALVTFQELLPSDEDLERVASSGRMAELMLEVALR